MSLYNSPMKTSPATLADLRESHCGLNTSALTLWRMSGHDAAAYLQSQLSNDIVALGEGEGQWTTLLDRKGRLRTLALCWRLADGFYFLGEEEGLAMMASHLEQFHFTEDYQQTPLSAGCLLAVAGPEALLSLRAACPALPLLATGLWCHAETPTPAENSGLFFSAHVLGEQVIYAWLPESHPLISFFENLPQLNDELAETARIEAGNVRLGLDTHEKTLIAETGLEHIAVSYTKGCYLGQEVVARLKTYGTAPRGLMGLVWKNGPAFETGLRLEVGGQLAGEVTSHTHSPQFGPIAIASLKKEWRVPGRTVSFDTPRGVLTAAVQLLPFYQRAGAQAEARQLYENALDEFTGVSEEEAITLLRRAVALAPTFANAYEALGVILARQGQLDEAISLMHHLAELNPDEVMAQTNLSLYYMKKGLIQGAEDAKARATALQFRAAAAKARQEREASARQVEEKQQLLERMAMFREVLEMDPDDPLANFGLGGAFLSLGEPENAVGYLKKSVLVQKDHSASYLALGKALAAAGEAAEAAEVFQQGIAVAGRKGDLMPLKDMQLRLMEIEQQKARVD